MAQATARRIGRRMQDIATTVRHYPGLTAHALAPLTYGQRRPAWNRVYAAFARAKRAGLIVAVPQGRFTAYVPPED